MYSPLEKSSINIILALKAGVAKHTDTYQEVCMKIIHLSQMHAQVTHTKLEAHTNLQKRTQIRWHTSRRVALHTQMNVPSNMLGGTYVTSASTSPPPPCTISQILISYQSSTEKFTLVHAKTEWLSSLL